MGKKGKGRWRKASQSAGLNWAKDFRWTNAASQLGSTGLIFFFFFFCKMTKFKFVSKPLWSIFFLFFSFFVRIIKQNFV